ncbi:serine hydroxymethyltransferase [candidate division TA06 bacterium]|nr:serine hydroxymethyltransferase [candidate division TA06 bacterium]
MASLKQVDPEIARAIEDETRRQATKLELIASENFVSEAILEAMGSPLTNKYAEGYPKKRYYGGCEFVDIAESLAIERAKKLFGCDHANVQPHSGAQANMSAYFALLNVGDKFFGLNLSHGGHLTHGHKVNFTGRFFNVVQYTVDPKTELIDYDALRKLALDEKPKLIVTGATAYPRFFDFVKFREICDEIGAYLVADIAHIAGLVATGLHPSPIPYADVVTTTTHKTLRGPRAGMILCKTEHAKAIDKTVFPQMQGGPLMHVIAAKAVCLKEALEPEFKTYQEQIVKNAKTLAEELIRLGYRLVAGGTDTHLMLVDLRSKNLTGKEAEESLDKAGITVNKNTIPYDPQKPFIASGIRIGTPAVTTRGMKEEEMRKIAGLMDRVLTHVCNDQVAKEVAGDVLELCEGFPLYEGRWKRRNEISMG